MQRNTVLVPTSAICLYLQIIYCYIVRPIQFQDRLFGGHSRQVVQLCTITIECNRVDSGSPGNSRDHHLLIIRTRTCSHVEGDRTINAALDEIHCICKGLEVTTTGSYSTIDSKDATDRSRRYYL